MNPQQQQQQQQHHHDYYDVDDDAHNHPSFCPSFRTYSTIPATHDIVSRLVSDDDDDFEFTALVTGLPGSSPVYPVFNRDLIRDHGSPVQLGKLFSDEDDEVHLKGASPETYCLWAPKSPSPSPGRCMKSSSTGSSSSSSSKAVSKTWKLRNLLRRCKSDGKEGLMLVTDTPPRKTAKSPASPQWGGGSSGSGKEATAAGRRKSYLPYKQDLLGFFGSPQALRKINIPPF